MKLYYPILISIIFLFSGCHKNEKNPAEKNCSTKHLQYFGFALVDVSWDDPLDEPSTKTNYLDEVAAFTNIADILVVNPTDDIVNRMQAMRALEVKAYLHLNEIFFELVDHNAPSGNHYSLRTDYQTRWTTFAATNNLTVNSTMVQAFYLGEEVFWNGISYEELKAAADHIKNTFPHVPIMMIEAYPVLDEIQIPSSIDWVGFDHYFIKNPNLDLGFQKELTNLKSKLSTEKQRIVLIMDTHYINWAHGDIGNISLDEMKLVASNYYKLALSETKTIAIIGYFWPSGFDDPMALGARHMSLETKEEYIGIGKAITGKE